jgi:peroxiredoxin
LQRKGRDDVVVAVVTFGSPGLLAAYRAHLDIDFAVLDDPERETYRAYGLARGSWRKIYRPATIRKYIELMRAGMKLRRPTDDTRQLGGDFVVGPDGTLRFVYRPVAPDDRPDAAEMLAALEPPAPA